MRRSLILQILLLALCAIGAWSWLAKPWEGWRARPEPTLHIKRFDRILDEYVSLGSNTALARMNMEYPTQTKLLIENVLAIGHIDEPDIEKRLRTFYLDSTVQVLLEEVHRQYSDLSDVEAALHTAFAAEKKRNPSLRMPTFYAQISCLRQSIIVADTLIGISLDKYLGADFPLYDDYYSAEQRQQMTRDSIASDALRYYLHTQQR
ncbi:MAG: gliding motility protein GldB [Bacteroidaceae bacterium]|nr:gliding motility protein GldB [Bacteroidaceae bacterium]